MWHSIVFLSTDSSKSRFCQTIQFNLLLKCLHTYDAKIYKYRDIDSRRRQTEIQMLGIDRDIDARHRPRYIIEAVTSDLITLIGNRDKSSCYKKA